MPIAPAVRRTLLVSLVALMPAVTMGRLKAAPAPAALQPAEPPNPLTTLKGLKCRFPAATSVVWKNGDAVAQTKTQEMLFTITAIDLQDGTAEFMGTAGRAYVTAVPSCRSIAVIVN